MMVYVIYIDLCIVLSYNAQTISQQPINVVSQLVFFARLIVWYISSITEKRARVTPPVFPRTSCQRIPRHPSGRTWIVRKIFRGRGDSNSSRDRASIFALIFCQNMTGHIHGIRQGLRKYSKVPFRQCHRWPSVAVEKKKEGREKRSF